MYFVGGALHCQFARNFPPPAKLFLFCGLKTLSSLQCLQGRIVVWDQISILVRVGDPLLSGLADNAVPWICNSLLLILRVSLQR